MMPPRDNHQAIRITLDDLKGLSTPDALAETAATGATPGAVKTYGNITSAVEESPSSTKNRGSIFLQAWFYLGVAGLVGALLAWGICEPAFTDGEGVKGWGNTWILPSIVAMLCVSFGLAESVVERSTKKAAYRTALALPLGILFGFVFDFIANIVYSVGLGMAASVGVHDYHNPTAWIARGLGWVVFGAAGGLVYGIIGQSTKKAQYGILGGMLGAGLGGTLFDPISFFSFGFHGAALSRMVGFSLFGMATGVSMGIVESALKDKWLYVSAGPLAGKQFILYKQVTTIGSSQQCDIYLFKDSNILPEHGVIEARGSHLQIRAHGVVYVSGQPIQTRVLQDGDFVQIGRYGFRYKEKQKS
jgi:hypothetical protein